MLLMEAPLNHQTQIVQQQLETVSFSQKVDQMYHQQSSDFRNKKHELTSTQQANRKELIQFINQKLKTKGGIYTNYLPSNDDTLGNAVGHDCLSESSGLWLEHLAERGTKEQYDRFYKQVKEKFFKDGQFTWIIKSSGKRANVNATTDDVRILISLVQAQARFHDYKYQKELKSLLKTFKEQSLQDGLLVDCYDPSCHYPAHTVALNYLNIKDLGYLNRLAGVSSEKLYQEASILKNGYISDQCPLYYESYNYQTKEYSNPNGNIDILHSLLSIYNLSQLKAVNSKTIDFIKDKVDKGTLYNNYDSNGKPLNNYQSSASYAIAALIAEELGDENLYQKAIDRALQFQVHDDSNELNGAIGDAPSKALYSFNNLMTIHALD